MNLPPFAYQAPTTRIAVAMRLGMDQDKVRVLAGDIGGSFGLKIGASREELAVAAGSRHLGRPVKWVEDRGENLTASGQAREESFGVRAAVSDDGDLLGLDVTMVVDTGAYPGMGAMVPAIMEGMLPGPYKLAALGFESTGVITNKATYVADVNFRGVGEGGMIVAPPTIVNAIEDALAPFGVRSTSSTCLRLASWN